MTSPEPRPGDKLASTVSTTKVVVIRAPADRLTGDRPVRKEDMILISVDDHIIEPPDMFVNHLPARYAGGAPRLVQREDGTDVWQFRDKVIPNSALNAVAGRPAEEYGLAPQGLAEIRPGCCDVHERVKDMNAGGILASMNLALSGATPSR